ncbi:MAG: peptidoglycan DD-metalloendopeptidase family protein [Candidatus Scalindua sp.]|nr:peptidoglycan DD-metalloendopeptidase family protein [Candidatus Scalindua sp.]
MNFISEKDVSIIVVLFILLETLSGCSTPHEHSTTPPLKFHDELDSLRTQTASSGSTKYTIKKGDTLWKIGYNFGVSPDTIINNNHISDVTKIKPGQVLIIPAGIPSYTKTTPSEKTVLDESEEPFIWPLQGKILTNFDQWIDGGKSTGIDIEAVNGQSVKASRGGIVALTSDTPDGWGKVIVLQHNDGSYTWYAHTSQILVKKNDTIKQGQVIAMAGSTGRAEQDKLHFKIFLHGVPVNPSYYLQ